jgi:antitoxin component of MazEF toxin-antitoxin module
MTAEQVRTVKKWLNSNSVRIDNPNDVYEKLVQRYGDDVYKLVQNAMLQPKTVNEAIGHTYANSANTITYMADNELSKEDVKKIVSLPQSSNSAQRTSAKTGNNETGAVQNQEEQQPVVRIIAPATSSSKEEKGENPETPAAEEASASITENKESAIDREKRLKQEQKDVKAAEKKLKKERAQIEKEVARLGKKIKQGKADENDLARFEALRSGLEEVSAAFSSLEQTKKTLKADIKVAKAEAKAEKKAAKAKAKAEAGENKGNFFSRLFHRSRKTEEPIQIDEQSGLPVCEEAPKNETAEQKKKRLQKHEKTVKEYKKIIEKEKKELAKKVKKQEKKGEAVSEADKARLTEIDIILKNIETYLPSVKTMVKEAKKAEKAAKKAEKEEKKKAKAAAKAAKKAAKKGEVVVDGQAESEIVNETEVPVEQTNESDTADTLRADSEKSKVSLTPSSSTGALSAGAMNLYANMAATFDEYVDQSETDEPVTNVKTGKSKAKSNQYVDDIYFNGKEH